MKHYKLWTRLGNVVKFSAESVEQAKARATKIAREQFGACDFYLREEESHIKHYRENYGVSKKGTITWTHWKSLDDR